MTIPEDSQVASWTCGVTVSVQKAKPTNHASAPSRATNVDLRSDLNFFCLDIENLIGHEGFLQV